jgi:hypothetical protein
MVPPSLESAEGLQLEDMSAAWISIEFRSTFRPCFLPGRVSTRQECPYLSKPQAENRKADVVVR